MNRIFKTLFTLSSLLLVTACINKPVNAPTAVSEPPAISKPKGTYSSVAIASAVANPNARGALVRVTWVDIEPDPDGELVTNTSTSGFPSVDSALQVLEASGKDFSYSLAVIAGPHSPAWLETLGASYMAIPYLGDTTVTIPKYWDAVVQLRLQILAQKLATRFKPDTRLKLVYIPQMTSNGVEGHFNGVTSANANILTEAGYTEDLWVQASVQAGKAFALAFDNKALAFEVHEILDNINVPERIMYALWEDAALQQRVGIAMWWINGQRNYQPDLVEIIKQFPGDKYGQIIGNSSQDCNPDFSCTDNMGKIWNNYGRYGQNIDGSGGFASVFTQARELGMRYIEPWNYEFTNNTYNTVMSEYNQYVDTNF